MALERLTLGVTKENKAAFVRHITDKTAVEFVLCRANTIYRDGDDFYLSHIPRIDCEVCLKIKVAQITDVNND